MSSPINFDWSQGRAFVQDGTIYYSPNCSRTVLIPNYAFAKYPFKVNLLNATDFRQPVWWTDVYGWQSFIPLAPSYTSSPFEPFCWMPRIIEVDVLVDPQSGSDMRQRRFQMHPDDCHKWTTREKMLVDAAELIRIWFKIPGNLPPAPGMFNYGRPHKSLRIAKKMISLARDWLAVWMGFVSYLIASSERYCPSSSPSYSKPDPNSPFPVWYHRLQEVHNYPASWLDGLSSSTICSYDTKTPRAGVILDWANLDKTQPPIEWFLKHHIPIWFVWSKAEENAFSRDRSLAFLKPPDDLVEDALKRLFDGPGSHIPLAGLVIQRYYSLGSDPVTNETVKLLKFSEAPSFVLKYTYDIFLDQEKMLAKVDHQTDASLSNLLQVRQNQQYAMSQASASLPTQTMIEGVEDKGKLYDHWREFLSRREKRHEEVMKVETAQERQRRLSREKKPGVKNADLYTWEKIQSSGGKVVYMRLRVQKRRNEHVFASYRSHHKIYNSFANEWDLCREFGAASGEDPATKTRVSTRNDSGDDSSDTDSEDDDGFDWLHNQYPQSTDQDVPYASVPAEQRPSTPQHEPIAPTGPDHYERPSTPRQSSRTEYRPVTPPRPDSMDTEDDSEDVSSPFLHYSQDVVQTAAYGYGYVQSMPGAIITKVSNTDWENILVTLGFVAPYAELDVEDHERHALFNFFNAMYKNAVLATSSDDLNDLNHAALRHLFDFQTIRRPSSDLLVFCGHRSTASEWFLGVHSADVALYVCRYILSNPGAHTVVTVATRLLERGIPFRTLLALDCKPRHMTISQSYSPALFRLANHVFTPQDFEAYMLQCQSLLSQPQGRAALLHGGIVWRIAKQFLSMDGVLSGPSVEVYAHRWGYLHVSHIPGTKYCDDELTANEIALICGTYSLYTAGADITIRSWFPPPSCWNKDRTGVQWVEWTARNEQFFGDLLRDIRAGKAKPLTAAEWTSRLRGLKTSRALRSNNRNRSAVFLDKVLAPA